MKIVFMVLGFLFLGSSFAWGAFTQDDMRLAGSLEWVCEPPLQGSDNTECNTTGSNDTFLRVDIDSLPTQVGLGLTGIGFMVAAAAVNRPVRQPVAPQPYQPPGGHGAIRR
jgi:hypothetical protein